MDKQELLQVLESQGISEKAVLQALADIPRDHFVNPEYIQQAWDNSALPLEAQQTISQPYIVALMTEALYQFQPKPSRVLEVGTGSGYQCAILANLFDEVYSIECIELLYKRAQQKLSALDLHNIQLKHGNGAKGWPKHAPFDGIIVTAAAQTLPIDLINQLKDPGRLVIPIGQHGHQKLLCIDKVNNNLSESCIELVTFVPLVENIT